MQNRQRQVDKKEPVLRNSEENMGKGFCIHPILATNN